MLFDHLSKTIVIGTFARPQYTLSIYISSSAINNSNCGTNELLLLQFELMYC